MNRKLLLQLFALVACLLCSMSAAAAEAYACYTPSNTMLTFYYDNQRSSRSGTTYNLNTGSNYPGWFSDGTNSSVTKVVFNSSFAGARPTTTVNWFVGMTNLMTIAGMEQYLNTSSVTDMRWMFSNCRGLTSLDLSGFNTARVTDMRYMLEGCSGLTSLDVSGFNTAQVTSMASMFYNCRGLTSLNLSSFNTANVTNMAYMFEGCSGLRTIYAGNGWTTYAVTYSNGMFNNCTSLVGGMGTTYDASHTNATYARIDGGPNSPGYFTDINAPQAYACYTLSDMTLTFYYDGLRSSRSGTTYDLNTGYNKPGWLSDGNSKLVTRVVFDSSFASARPTSTFNWFCGMYSLGSITGLSYLNTSEVTNMANMFMGYQNRTNFDLSHFDTSKVTDMHGMFAICWHLRSLNMSGWNTSNVTNMKEMFSGCSSLESLDVSSLNTSKVTDMGGMFEYCSALTSLDLSVWNTSKVTDMTYMFCECSNLTTIYVGSSWSTLAVTSSTDMFENCTNLKGGQGTTYSSSHVDKAYAHIDGGPSNPGYFTEKPAYMRGDVNGDNIVSIIDVTALIDYLLTGNSTGIDLSAANVNQDSGVTISDVTALIDYLLTGSW